MDEGANISIDVSSFCTEIALTLLVATIEKHSVQPHKPVTRIT
jgi:hypothetical protein